ncbi:MAG: hypothetical protein ABI623_07605, partial [bacterium]
AAIFGSTLMFTTEIQKKNQEVTELRGVLDVKTAQISENTTLMSSISALQDQLGKYKASMALYDSLVPGADKYTKAFSQLSNGINDLNSIWVNDFSATEAGQATMNGFAVNRSRIPRLSSLFDRALLKEVTTEEIRGETVYKYKIEVPSLTSSPK